MSHYNPQTFWDNAAQDPDVRYKYIADEWADTDIFLTVIEQSPIKWGKVLEIGCGIGRLLDPLSDKYETCEFYGVDISPEMLKLAPKKHNIKYSTKFEADKLDLVYSMLVFQHITHEDKVAYINKAYSALKPNGVLLFQFVDGKENTPYSYQTDPVVIHNLLYLAGFQTVTFTQGILHDDWVFAMAVK